MKDPKIVLRGHQYYYDDGCLHKIRVQLDVRDRGKVCIGEEVVSILELEEIIHLAKEKMQDESRICCSL